MFAYPAALIVDSYKLIVEALIVEKAVESVPPRNVTFLLNGNCRDEVLRRTFRLQSFISN